MYRCVRCGEMRPHAVLVTRGTAAEWVCHPQCGDPSGAAQGHPDSGKGCCTTCVGSGAGDAYGKCWDCYGTGHVHSPEQACEPTTEHAEWCCARGCWGQPSKPGNHCEGCPGKGPGPCTCQRAKVTR